MDVNLTSSQLDKESLDSFFETSNFNAMLHESKSTLRNKKSHFTSMLPPDGAFDYEQGYHNLLTPKSSIESTISNLTLPSSLHPTISSKVSNNSSQAGSIGEQCRRGNNSFFRLTIFFSVNYHKLLNFMERHKKQRFLCFRESNSTLQNEHSVQSIKYIPVQQFANSHWSIYTNCTEFE